VVINEVDVSQWYGLFAPAGTSAAVIAQINRALNKALSNPQVVGRFERQGARVEAGPPDALRERILHDFARWQGVVSQGGLTQQDVRLLATD
jgi:tripartite-type tricarboxylate transporter receptor subunit TctC